jgi:hypothetical protein
MMNGREIDKNYDSADKLSRNWVNFAFWN